MPVTTTIATNPVPWFPSSAVRTVRFAFRRHRSHLIRAFIALVVFNFWLWGMGRNDVLSTAYAIPDGGGYCSLSDTGVQHTITHNGSIVVPASRGGSYCCGFTFDVAVQVAQRRGLLAGKSVAQVRQFQREWYGSDKQTALKECAAAVVHLGIGREIESMDAKPGDFVTFHRTNGMGHSVVFLNWIKDGSGKIVGLHYRSSQPPSGVGDGVECFADTDYGHIDRNRFFVARLNRPLWSRLLYPLSPR